MTFITYKKTKFRPETLKIIDVAGDIIASHERQGFSLTLRQLYYQFVARGLIPNTERSYKKIGSIILDARMAGLISWTAIEDRTRNLRALPHWKSPAEIVEAASSQFRMDKWLEQRDRVEVWIEKDALIGVIEAVCQQLDVPCFSCRGYVSASEVWVAAQRLIERERKGYNTTILHLGDHDPSGIDMTRDISDRLMTFGARTVVDRIALTMEQIEELNPPPNPAKVTDSRFEDYRREYGEESWELDALNPTFITDLVTRSVLDLRDEDAWESMVEKEEEEKANLRKIVEDLAKKGNKP